MNICAVILAGGSGSRLWPVSRASHPKQFLNICSDHTMLQETVLRLDCLNINSSVIICNEEHRFFVAEQLREINKLDKIILEPVGRNTAPAISLAAFSILDDPLMFVLPSDQVIQNEDIFKQAVLKAIPLAESGKLVTFGIVPKSPNTGFGYIKTGEGCGDGFLVDKFIEKPSYEKAQKYLSSGNYLWNSGMFLFKKSIFLAELNKFRPKIYKATEKAFEQSNIDLDFIRVEEKLFKRSPHESIDCALMENTNEAVCVEMNCGWSDVGSWSALWDISLKDDKNNVCVGDVRLTDTKNSYIRSDDKLVVTIGVEDLIVVSTKDALMVCHKNHTQDVKTVANNLKLDSRSEWQFDREVYRPWGKYDSVDSGDRYQVKRITVKPGAKLSVQMHHHRAEHWVVVSGTAKVTKGEDTILLSENESVYLPLGIVHALENPGKVPLELIEVQSGAYLGEDDIVRFEDRYGRTK